MRALTIVQVIAGCLASPYADLEHPATEFQRTDEKCETYNQRKGELICLMGADDELYYYEPVYYQPEEPVWDYDQWFEDTYGNPDSYYHPRQPLYAVAQNQRTERNTPRLSRPKRDTPQLSRNTPKRFHPKHNTLEQSHGEPAVEYGDHRDYFGLF